MLEYSIIQTRGFANVTEGGRVTGFQLLVRMPNYRGAWGSLIDGAEGPRGGEGRREPYRGREQVRRQHALLRSLSATP